MDEAKRRRLEERGWKVGTVQEFLGLTDAEMAYIDFKLALRDELKKRRAAGGPSQAKLAKQVGVSRSCIARMEEGDPGASIDLLVRTLLAAGATPAEIATAMMPARPLPTTPRKPRKTGSAKGSIKMADDFDEPLEDFRDYM